MYERLHEAVRIQFLSQLVFVLMEVVMTKEEYIREKIGAESGDTEPDQYEFRCPDCGHICETYDAQPWYDHKNKKTELMCQQCFADRVSEMNDEYAEKDWAMDHIERGE